MFEYIHYSIITQFLLNPYHFQKSWRYLQIDVKIGARCRDISVCTPEKFEKRSGIRVRAFDECTGFGSLQIYNCNEFESFA